MISIKSKYLCPFCFSKVDPENILFQCINPDCEKKEYQNYNDFWKEPSPINIVFKPGRENISNLVDKATCPKCETPTTRKICPYCLNIIIDKDDKHISLVGPANAGKSVFLAVIFHLIKERKLLANLKPKPYEPLTFSIYNEYERLLYQERILPTGTTSIIQNKKLRHPFIMELKQKLRKYKNYLVLFDTSGEDVEKDMERINYLKKSGGIILFLDISNRDSIQKSIKTLDNLIKHLKKDNKLIRIPVAVVIPKIDIFLPKLREGFIENIDCNNLILKHSKIDKMDGKVVNLLEFLNLNEFKEKIDGSFRNYKFFAISSLGFNPKKPPKLEREPQPINVCSPLLWILSQINDKIIS